MRSDNFWQNQLTAGTFKADCRNLNNGYPIPTGYNCGVLIEGETNICSGQSTTLTATGWDSYQWSHGLGSNATVTVNPTSTTTYTVTGTTGDNSAVDTVVVFVENDIQVTASIAPSSDDIVHGTISPASTSQSCASSSPITISISAETGYYITRIVVNGATVENFADENPLISNHTYIINDPRETNTWNIVAHLSNQYRITTTTVLNDEDETVITASGLVTPNNGNLVVTAFSDTTVYFHETARYAIEEVFVNGASYGAIDSFEFNGVAEHFDIKLVYADDCGITRFSYTEGFEDYATGSSAAFPDCYEKLTMYSPYPYVSTSYPKTGSKSFYFYTTPTTYNMIVFPMIKVEDADITDLRVRFHARASNTGAIMEVGVMTNALDANTFAPCDTARFSKTNEYSLYTTYLNNYQHQGKFIAFRFTTSASASAYMDDVTIDLAPDCIEPEGLTISNIGGRTAQINWIASTGNPDYYDLEIIETATEYSVVQENLYGETSYLAEGLDPNTSYTVKLYSVCEGGAVYSPLVTTTFNTLNTTDCATPNLFKVSNVTAYTADLSWVKDGLHDNYYIEYKTASAIAWENETINSYNSLELFNLTPASTYTARIRSICDDDENSAWATITFETPCATIISMPFTENFNNTPDGDNSNGLLPHCWASNNSHTANKPYVNTQTTINEQFHSAYGALDFQHAPGYNIVILPPIDLSESGYNLNDLAVNFWAKAENITAGEFHLGVMGNTMDTATFTPVYAITLDSTTIWKEFYIPLTDYEGDGQYIAFRWRNASDNSVSVDDIYIDFTTTCTRPESLTMDSVTAHEVYFSWVDEVNVSWEAVCVSSNDALNWANAVPVSGLAGNLSNLSPNTKYTLYLRTTCGSDSYSLPLSFSFTTACAPITPGDLPYTEDFNNYGAGSSTYFPTCWTRASQTSTTNPYISSTYNSSPGSLYFLGNATNYVSAVTEKFDMQVNTLQMTFEFRSGNLSVPITIGVMTNPNDPTSFDTITSVFASKINTWEKHTVYLNNYQGTGQYIAFRTIGATAVYLDDIKIDLAPDCIPVQNLAISNLTTSSADFTWTGPENAESYEIEVGLPGFTPGDGSAVITAVATDDFYNITPGDLDEAKAYVFAIRSFCGGDDGESIWTLLNFATIADETYGDEIWHGYVYKSPTPDVPANRFGTYLGKVFEQPIFNRDPGSSTTISWTGDSAVWAGTAPSEYFAVRYKMTYDFPCDYYTFTFTGIDDAIRFSVDGGQNWVSLCHTNGNCGPQYSWTTLAYPTGTFTGKAQMDGPADLILEYFNAAGGKKCAFSYAPAAIGISTSDIKINSIDVDFTDGEEWDIIVSTSVQTDLTNPTNVVANHTGITSNPYTIPGLTPETIYYIYAKLACGTVWGNTSATTLPSCPAVTNLQATATTTNTATVTWVENGTSTNWEIEYGNAGFTLGTGYTATVSGTPSYNITANLSASNSYDFYVRSICSSSDTSAWSAKGNFATECDVITQLPYTENFNSYSPASTSDRNVFPNCWSRYSTGANLPYIANWGTTHVYEGTGYSLDFAYTPTYYTLAILPAFDTSIPVNTLTVSFQGRSGTGSSGNFTIGVMDNALDYSSFVPVDTAHNHTTAFQPYAISLASYTGTGQIIAFKWEGGNSNGYYLDELVINYATALTCAVPTGLTATNIEANSATAGWNASATAVTYTLEYKKSADATYNAPVTGIATTSHPLTGLEAGTQYDVRVKSVCTDGESNFTAAFTFTTESKPCPEPTNLSVSQITGESAVATWTKGGDETSWKVEYKVKSSSGGYTSVTVTTPSYPISDLEAETEYEVCVKADCGGSESTRACTTFTTSAAGTTYKIEASAGSNGSINPSGSVTVAEGADITFTFHPDNGYKVQTVTVNGQVVTTTTDSTHTITNVQANGTIHVEFVLDGIGGYDLASTVTIFPNPAEEVLNVRTEEVFEQVLVTNMLGQVIHASTVNGTDFQINVSQYGSGVYFIKLTGKQGMATKKFVVK